MADLLLVNPLFLEQDPMEQRLMTPYYPLGLLYLAGVARDAGYDVALFDCTFDKDDRRFIETLERDRPAVVGLSILTTVRRQALRLAELAQARGATVVVGGADPTGRPETYLEHEADGRRAVDIVVMGEGEQTFTELLPIITRNSWSAADLAGVAGLAFVGDDGAVQRTDPRSKIGDLDRLPAPARDLLDLEPHRRAWRERHGYFSLSLIATRGCPFDCSWCQRTVFGRSFRPRSPRAVAEEMRRLKDEQQPDRIRIVDDVMGVDRTWVREWRDEVVRLDAAIPFECLSRANLVTDELLGQLKEAGCFRVAFGAESGSQKVLDAMNKGITVDQVREAAKLCRRHGLECYFFIMVGYPGEEWKDILLTVGLLRDCRPDQFSATIAYPLPDTTFFEEVKEQLVDSPDWDFTAENRLLFERPYSSMFYRWVLRMLSREWLLARIRHGDQQAGLVKRLRTRAEALLARTVVEVLRRLPRRAAQPKTLSSET